MISRSGDLHALGAAQQPTYPDPAAVDAAVARLRTVPPLVFAGECDDLKAKIAAVARGEAFLLQGGDCAETFDGVTADNVRNKLRVLLQMAVVLTYAASVPVVKVGRLAGQYAKPRSSDLETRDGVTLPAYRGDAVNGYDFTAESRAPRPAAAGRRLPRLRRDAEPRARLRHRRLRRPAPGAHLEHRLRPRVRGRPALRADGRRDRAGADLHAGHRRRPRRVPPGRLPLQPRGAGARVRARDDPHRLAAPSTPYDVSAHFVWIGERTRQLDGAHVELLRHIRNPIGVKLGPTTTPDDALALAAKLNPDNEPGRLTFITRFGAEQDPRRPARRWSRRSPPPASRSPGSATRCTATPSRRPRATRPAASTT